MFVLGSREQMETFHDHRQSDLKAADLSSLKATINWQLELAQKGRVTPISATID